MSASNALVRVFCLKTWSNVRVLDYVCLQRPGQGLLFKKRWSNQQVEFVSLSGPEWVNDCVSAPVLAAVTVTVCSSCLTTAHHTRVVSCHRDSLAAVSTSRQHSTGTLQTQFPLPRPAPELNVKDSESDLTSAARRRLRLVLTPQASFKFTESSQRRLIPR